MWGAPLQPMGNLRRICTQVHDPSELRFGVVHGVRRGIGGDAACSQITLGNVVRLNMHGTHCSLGTIGIVRLNDMSRQALPMSGRRGHIDMVQPRRECW